MLGDAKTSGVTNQASHSGASRKGQRSLHSPEKRPAKETEPSEKKRGPASPQTQAKDASSRQEPRPAKAHGFAAVPLLGPRAELPLVSSAPQSNGAPLHEAASAALGSVAHFFGHLFHRASGQRESPEGDAVDGPSPKQDDLSPRDASDAVEPAAQQKKGRKGFWANRKKLPTHWESPSGQKLKPMELLQRLKLIQAYHLQGAAPDRKATEEGTAEIKMHATYLLAKKLGPLRPSMNGQLGEPTDTVEILETLEGKASSADLQRAEKFVQNQRGRIKSDAREVETLIGNGGAFVDFTELEDGVFDALLTAPNGMSSLKGLYEKTKAKLKISDGNEPVTVQTAGNETVFPIEYDRLWTEVVAENAKTPLTFKLIQQRAAQEYAQRAQEMGLEGPARVSENDLETMRLEQLAASGHLPRIQFVDFVEPSREYIEESNRRAKKQGRPANLTGASDEFKNIAISAVARDIMDDVRGAFDAEARAAIKEYPTLKKAVDEVSGNITHDELTQLMRKLGLPVFDERALYQKAVEKLEHKSKYVNLYNQNHGLIGRLRTPDWFRIFGLPRSPDIDALVASSKAQEDMIDNLRTVKGKIRMTPEFASDFNKAVLADSDAEAVAQTLLNEAKKKTTPTTPVLFTALKSLQLKRTGDSVLLKTKGAKGHSMTFAQLVALVQKSPFPMLDLDALDAVLRGDDADVKPTPMPVSTKPKMSLDARVERIIEEVGKLQDQKVDLSSVEEVFKKLKVNWDSLKKLKEAPERPEFVDARIQLQEPIPGWAAQLEADLRSLKGEALP